MTIARRSTRIAVEGSRERLDDDLMDYQERYAAACAEYAAWDQDMGDDWTPEHDRMLEAFARRHRVYGPIISGTTFAIVEVLGEPLAAPRAVPPGARPAA
jgi:hypothetical protein